MISNTVALLAEGVDRNLGKSFRMLAKRSVALLAEGVDRNVGLQVILNVA